MELTGNRPVQYSSPCQSGFMLAFIQLLIDAKPMQKSMKQGNLVAAGFNFYAAQSRQSFISSMHQPQQWYFHKNSPLNFYITFALDNITNCICAIHCLTLHRLDLNIVHKLSSKEENSQQSWAAGWVAPKIVLFVKASSLHWRSVMTENAMLLLF